MQGGATAVRWSGDTADELFTLPQGGLISSVSGDERFLYGNSMLNGDPFTEAPFRWSEDAGVEQLPVADGFAAGAVLGISFDGRIAIGYSLDDDFPHETVASVWIDGEHTSFGEFLAAQGMDSVGWEFGILTAISDDGNVVVGYGTDPSGRFGTFVAIVPAPPAMLGLLVGALAGGHRRR
jgi:hypothetical protein